MRVQVQVQFQIQVWVHHHLGSRPPNNTQPTLEDPKNCAFVVGGAASMWGETVDTSDLMQTVWPRAGAVGERLWSAASVNDSDAALPRYVKFRWRQGLMVDWEAVSHG